jgi:ABC-2 type transport system permease protein
MFKALLKTRLAAVGAFLVRKGGGRNDKSSKLKIIGLSLLMLYAFFAFMMMFGIYFQQIAKPFFQAGLGWLYFTLFAMTAFAMMFIGSVFTVKSQLYEAKDNELLLSLPIPPRLILGSRMIMIMILNFVFELLVAVPAFVMWLRAAPVTFSQVISFVVLILALPFLSVAISGVFGWLLALSTGRVRNKSLMTVLFSVIFLGLYFLFFGRANVLIQQLVMNGKSIAGSLGSVAPLFWIGNSVAEPNALQLVLSVLIMLLPFVLMYYLLTVTFIRVATAKRGTAKLKYEEKAMHSSTLSSALFNREMKHLLSSPVYILNAGLGVIFIVVAAVALVIKKDTILALAAQMGIGGATVSAAAVFALCLLCTTVLFTAPSVSLEGKSLWIVKSLPISAKDILNAKLHLHIYVTAPAIFLAAAAAVYVIVPSIQDAAIVLCAPVFYVMLSANIGLICNLKSPRFDWINETQVIKQSMSVLMAMLISSLLVIIPGVLYFVALGAMVSTTLFMVVYTLVLIIGWFISRKWILTMGAEIFDGLG